MHNDSKKFLEPWNDIYGHRGTYFCQHDFCVTLTERGVGQNRACMQKFLFFPRSKKVLGTSTRGEKSFSVITLLPGFNPYSAEILIFLCLFLGKKCIKKIFKNPQFVRLLTFFFEKNCHKIQNDNTSLLIAIARSKTKWNTLSLTRFEPSGCTQLTDSPYKSKILNPARSAGKNFFSKKMNIVNMLLIKKEHF